MADYRCKKCDTVWNTGFFHNDRCPQCFGWIRRSLRMLKFVILIGALAGGSWFVLSLINHKWSDALVDKALVVLDSRDFYSYGSRPYFGAVLSGTAKDYWVIRQKVLFWDQIVDTSAVETPPPRVVFSPRKVIRMGNVVRNGGDVWAPAEFYEGTTLVRGFVLLPRHWQDAVTAYDWEATTASYQNRFEAFVSKNVALKKMAAGGQKEKVFAEENPEYYKINGFGSRDTAYYALKTSQEVVDKARDYYLNSENIAIDVLQTQADFSRPALKTN